MKLGVGLYREYIPEDIEEYIREAEQFGNPLTEQEITNERRKADYWSTCSLGVIGFV